MLKNGFYNAAAGLVRMGLALLTIPLLIRIIGVEEYGLWTLASAVVGLVALAEAGLSTTTTVFVCQDLGKEDIDGLSQTLTVTVGAMLVLATLAAISLWIGAETIVNLFPKLRQAQQLSVIQTLQIGGLVVWARLQQQVLIGVEQAYQRYGLMNLLNTIQWLLLSLGLLAVAWLGGRIVELMQWQAVASVAVLLSHLWMVRSLLKGIHLRPVWNVKKAIIIARHSLMIWMTTLGGAIFARGDRLVVGSFLGFETLGVYAAITEATGAINSFSALPVQPLVPVLINQTAKHTSSQDLKQLVKQALEVNALVALGCGALLYMFAPFIMHLMLGGAVTEQNIFAFRIATVIYGLYSLNAVGFYILLSLAVNIVMSIQLFSSILSLMLIAIGSSNFGLLGAITGNVGFLITWLMILFALQEMKINLSLWFECLWFPFMWFLVVIFLLFSIDNNLKNKALVCISLGIILCIWFWKVQKYSIRSIIYK